MPHQAPYQHDHQYRSYGEVLFRHWETSIIYHTDSGNIYSLDQVTSAVLEHLTSKPASVSQLIDTLTAEYEIDNPEQLGRAVRSSISNLIGLDLIVLDAT